MLKITTPKEQHRFNEAESRITLGQYIRSQFGKTPKKRKFTDLEKRQLRPIAEVLAVLDGNAFFGISTNDRGEDDWYEQYLPEAWLIFKSNGKDGGWIQETSWMKQLDHENEGVKDAFNQWQLLKQLSRKR